MVKKKQKDFHKTTLRVGKTKPRGKNVTDTSFTSKKIVTRTQLHSFSAEVTLEGLLSQASSSKNSNTKKELLHKIDKYVLKHNENLPLDFNMILKKIGPILCENDIAVRHSALDLINACVSYLSDAQMNCFLPSLLSYLKCMMTHGALSVRKDSLILFDSLLHSYPSLVSHSVTILNNLLDLIAHGEGCLGSTTRKRKLSEVVGNRITSKEWRVEVLCRIVAFLETLSTQQKLKEMDEEENTVYLIDDKPLYLPLYARSGITALALDHPWHSDKSSQSVEKGELKNFMYHLAPLLSDMARGEMVAVKHNGISGTHSQDTIDHLAVIVHILCCWEDWVLYTNDIPSDMDIDLRTFIASIIQGNIIKGFPFLPSPKHKSNKEKHKYSPTELNMYICYLFSIYESKTSLNHKMSRLVFSYFTEVLLKGFRMSHRALVITLKACRNYFNSKSVKPESKVGILLALCGILEDKEDRNHKKLLRSFIMEITLNYDYRDLYNAPGMNNWFGRILPKELNEMIINGEIDKPFFKYLRQVCVMGFQEFSKSFEGDGLEKLIGHLADSNEEIQITIVHFIAHLPIIDANTFHKLSETLSHLDVHVPTAIRLIRSLSFRFMKQDVPTSEKVQFMIFLLNLAFDTSAFNKEDPTVNAEEANKFIPLPDCRYTIVPIVSSFQRRVEIYEECMDYILIFVQEEKFEKLLIHFFLRLLTPAENVPLHSAMCLLKSVYKIGLMEVNALYSVIQDLLYSSLYAVYCGKIYFSDQRIQTLGLPDLQESLQLKSCYNVLINKALQLLQNAESDEQINIDFILRMYKVFINLECISSTFEEGPNLIHSINILQEFCKDSPQQEQFNEICEAFNFY